MKANFGEQMSIANFRFRLKRSEICCSNVGQIFASLMMNRSTNFRARRTKIRAIETKFRFGEMKIRFCDTNFCLSKRDFKNSKLTTENKALNNHLIAKVQVSEIIINSCDL